MTSLKRYWLKFENISHPTPLKLGCGVRAYDYDDAVNLLCERVFVGKNPPAIVGHTEDVDVATLDHKHVVPNMGVITVRGSWFPQGYDALQ